MFVYEYPYHSNSLKLSDQASWFISSIRPSSRTWYKCSNPVYTPRLASLPRRNELATQFEERSEPPQTASASYAGCLRCLIDLISFLRLLIRAAARLREHTLRCLPLWLCICEIKTSPYPDNDFKLLDDQDPRTYITHTIVVNLAGQGDTTAALSICPISISASSTLCWRYLVCFYVDYNCQSSNIVRYLHYLIWHHLREAQTGLVPGRSLYVALRFCEKDNV